mmetsp:Transcript_17560/g.31522  ORF Transcript_17560/g.31522 Transcript_17560/m.31522 type:complete len:132 (-) Transcript_17560:511-906(-)
MCTSTTRTSSGWHGTRDMALEESPPGDPPPPAAAEGRGRGPPPPLEVELVELALIRTRLLPTLLTLMLDKLVPAESLLVSMLLMFGCCRCESEDEKDERDLRMTLADDQNGGNVAARSARPSTTNIIRSSL